MDTNKNFFYVTEQIESSNNNEIYEEIAHNFYETIKDKDKKIKYFLIFKLDEDSFFVLNSIINNKLILSIYKLKDVFYFLNSDKINYIPTKGKIITSDRRHIINFINKFIGIKIVIIGNIDEIELLKTLGIEERTKKYLQFIKITNNRYNNDKNKYKNYIIIRLFKDNYDYFELSENYYQLIYTNKNNIPMLISNIIKDIVKKIDIY